MKVEVPSCMKGLPVERGLVVPWFVAKVSDEQGSRYDHRVADGQKLLAAIKFNLCWVTGNKLGSHRFIIVSPMALFSRVTAEPPCVLDAALYSAQVCPFLTGPERKRRERNLPEGTREHVGMIGRNPGVVCVVKVSSCVPTRVQDDVLFKFEPCGKQPIRWFCEGREASPYEIYRGLVSAFDVLMTQTGAIDGSASPSAFKLAYERMMVLMQQYVGPPKTLSQLKEQYQAETASGEPEAKPEAKCPFGHG